MRKALMLAMFLTSPVAMAANIDSLIAKYSQETGGAAFSAARGKSLYLAERTNSKGETLSCATCHTADPRKPGKSRANKELAPLAPSASAERFTDEAKVEKWFKRNCQDVLDRPCTTQEKGEFLTFLKSVR